MDSAISGGEEASGNYGKVLEGKAKKFREENPLLTQPFVKNPDQTIGALLTENISKIGENIQIGEFYRIEL